MANISNELDRLDWRIAELERCIAESRNGTLTTAGSDDRMLVLGMLERTLELMRRRQRELKLQSPAPSGRE
jgi:hypothetical protein